MMNQLRTRRFLLTGLFLASALACAIRLDQSVERQGWWHQRGPVVPHDSFPSDCSLCHTGEGWNTIRKDFTFDHTAETGVELKGSHAVAECLRCHNDRGPVEVFASRGCSGCHEDLHRGQLGKNCADCHTETAWPPREPIARHHRTRFPLVGAHAAAACWRCHPGAQAGNFVRADTECINCHATDLARALDPDHVTSGFVDNCDRCHIPTDWERGFVHASFPLQGAHAAISDCTSCHTGNVFAGTPNNCSDCHLDDYNDADDPDHVALSLPLDCMLCHTEASWEGALFSHPGITNGCVRCHQDDYNTARDPNHVALSFSTTCEDCHSSTSTWQGAAFSHVGITSGCVDCHQQDYKGAANPNHIAAAFSMSCEQCHNTRSWQGAAFDHDFPITSGAHSRFDCSDCHLRPATFASFSCTHCHAHSQRDMGQEHDRVPGYVWQSNSCLACHPNGQE